MGISSPGFFARFPGGTAGGLGALSFWGDTPTAWTGKDRSCPLALRASLLLPGENWPFSLVRFYRARLLPLVKIHQGLNNKESGLNPILTIDNFRFFI
jgi:hypothetical protein